MITEVLLDIITFILIKLKQYENKPQTIKLNINY